MTIATKKLSALIERQCFLGSNKILILGIGNIGKTSEEGYVWDEVEQEEEQQQFLYFNFLSFTRKVGLKDITLVMALWYGMTKFYMEVQFIELKPPDLNVPIHCMSYPIPGFKTNAKLPREIKLSKSTHVQFTYGRETEQMNRVVGACYGYAGVSESECE